MADEHIYPGFLTPSAAEVMRRAARQAEESRQKLANQVPPSDEKDFPAVITSGSGGYHAWTEQAFDATGARYTKPAGRTGTAAVNPACMPNRTTIIPQEVWLRRTIWDATYGVIYEIISNISGEQVLTSFAFDYPTFPAGNIVPQSTLTTLVTLTLDPGTYIFTIDAGFEVVGGGGGADLSNVSLSMEWGLGTATGILPATKHDYETIVTVNSFSTGNSNCNPYYSDVIVIATAGTIELYATWDYTGARVPQVALIQGNGSHLTISEGVNPYAIGSIAIGSTPVTGSNAGAILYSNGTTLQQVAVTPVGGIVSLGSGAPVITDFVVGALASQLWQNLR